MIQVEIDQSGEFIEFPENTPDWEINSAMRRIVADKSADKSPIPHESTMPDYRGGFDANYQWQPSGDDNTEYDHLGNIKKSGIATDKPAPAGLFEAGLGYTEKDRAVAMEVALEEHFGKPVPVKPSQYGLQWLDPETNRWTLATKYGPDVGDLKEHSATIAQISSEVLGSLAGLPLGPGGVIGGGVGAAFVSEYARLKMGKANGTNRNMDDTDILKSALVNSGLAYVGGKLGDVVLKLIKGADNALKGRFIPKEAVDAVEHTPKEVQQTIDQIQSKSKSNATPSLGKQSGDEVLLRIEEGEIKNTSSEFGQQFRDRQAQNRQAAVDALDAENQAFGPTPDSSYEFGRGLAKEAESQTQPRLDAAQADVDKALATGQSLESSLPTPALIRSGQEVRGSLMSAKQEFENWADRAYKQDLEKFATDNGISMESLNVPLRNTSRLANDLDAQISDVEKLFPNLSQAERKVIANADDLNPLFSGGDLTFDQYRKATSFLKKRIRLGENQLGESPNDIATMKRLLGSLKQDYESALKESGNEALIDHMKHVDSIYQQGRTIFDNDVIGELLAETKGGLWYVKDADVFKQIFSPGNHEVAERVAGVLSSMDGGENAMQAIRREMMAEYRKQVFADGRPIPGKHKQFMQEYEEVLRPYFRGSEWKIVKDSKNLADAITRIEKRNERIKGEIQNTFEYKLAKEARGGDVTYHDLFQKVWGGSKVGQVEAVKKILAGNRSLLNQFKSLAANDIRRSLVSDTVKGQGLNLKYNTFSNYLENNAGSIRALFGNEYYSNLLVVKDYVKLAQRTGEGANFSNSGTWLAQALKLGWRAYVGPLSHTGYAVNKMTGFTEDTARRILTKVILEPELLDEMIKASTLSNKSRVASKIAGIIYMTDIDDEFINTPDVVEPMLEGGVNMMGNMFTPEEATQQMQSIPR